MGETYFTEQERDRIRGRTARAIREQTEARSRARKQADDIADLKEMGEELMAQKLASSIDNRLTVAHPAGHPEESIKEDPRLPNPPPRGMGLKFDGGKVQARLLYEGMPRALLRVIDTLDFGAKKYAAHSWQHVENALERYQDASYRHDLLRCRGERLDSETGIHHRAHHIINELFLLELELRAEESPDALPTEVK